ncbi:PE family protein PE1 [Mycobacterium tuberculosis M1559]|nr:PE family protein PE1 [Mycobacterium tuberculosis M1559]KBE22721.1 PE family protein PE1 [Mycobacterium tuberculosis M2479]
MAPFGFTPKARHNRGVALRSTYRLDGWVMGPVDKEGWGLSYVFAQPSVLAAAATDLAGIGSAINQATAAVAAPTTGLAAAAADEVSTALATLFGAYGQQFQAISAQVAAFHNEFTQRLAAAANAFVNAEATNTSALVQEATAGLFKPTSPPVLPPMFNQNTAIIMGGTGSPIPTPSYVNAITTLFIDPVVSNPVVKALVTPEELYPITGVKSLPFQTSVQLGLQILDGAIWEQINAGNHVTVFGYSQSAVIASLEMQHLISLGPNAPSPSQLNFILIGNEMNPNGAILARIPGLNVTTLGLPFYGATPDNPYPTTTYTLEYDGFADFPRYPLNVLSDINAVFGILTVHTTYGTSHRHR